MKEDEEKKEKEQEEEKKEKDKGGGGEKGKRRQDHATIVRHCKAPCTLAGLVTYVSPAVGYSGRRN